MLDFDDEPIDDNVSLWNEFNEDMENSTESKPAFHYGIYIEKDFEDESFQSFDM